MSVFYPVLSNQQDTQEVRKALISLEQIMQGGNDSFNYAYNVIQRTLFESEVNIKVTDAPTGGQLRLWALGYQDTSKPSVIFRNDGTTLYVLLTDPNNQDGKWNDLRPYYINLTTGANYFGTPLFIGTDQTYLKEGEIRVRGTVANPDGIIKAWAQAYNNGYGVLYAGQDDLYGGGIRYNSVNDLVSLFRNNNGTYSTVASWSYTSNDVYWTGQQWIENTAPRLNFSETDQTDPAGRWRIVADGGNFRVDRSTGAGWASISSVMTFRNTDQITVLKFDVSSELLLPTSSSTTDRAIWVV